MGVLVVGGEAQRVDAVVVSIVGSIEVVDHTADRAILIAVVESADETEFCPIKTPTATPVSRQLEVGPRSILANAPVVDQSVVKEVDHRIAAPIGAQRAQFGVHTARERPHPTIEAQEVGGRRLRREEGAEDSLRVATATQREMERVAGRNFLGVDEDESARVVGRILSRGRLDNHHVVDLPTGNHVETEGATVGLATGRCPAIDPNVIVALGESAHHHKLSLDKAHARDAADHLAGVAVLTPLDFLCGDVAHDDGAGSCGVDHGGIRIQYLHRRHGHVAQLLFVGRQRDAQVIFCAVGLSPNSVNIFGFVGYILDDKGVALTLVETLEVELSINVGSHTQRSFLHLHGCTDQRLLRLGVDHHAPNVLRPCSYGKGERQQGNARESMITLLHLCLSFVSLF